MSISLIPEAEAQVAAASRAAAGLLAEDVASIELIGGGRNSRVYRIVASSGRRCALKAYFSRSDNRNCLETEFAALQFLWANGIRDVPQPLAVDRQQRCALYEYIDGRKPGRGEISPADIDAAVAFLGRLKDLRGRPGSASLPAAAEACFSGDALVANLQGRIDRLQAHPEGGPTVAAFRAFMAEELRPASERIIRWSCGHPAFDRQLPQSERTLSPSDFGFHNAINRGPSPAIGAAVELPHPQGGGGSAIATPTAGSLAAAPTSPWVFLDFEYFGWDDPVKMLSDFLLHPAMEVTDDLKRRFTAGLLGEFADYRLLAERLIYLYPLFGLKWCLILLNEFLPEHFRRRQFAAPHQGDKDRVQEEQLAKARQKLQQVYREYEQFPYCG